MPGDEVIGLAIWGDLETFDDILTAEEKQFILQLEQEENRVECPFLKKEGEFWHYCGCKLTEEHTDKIPTPQHPIYQAYQSSTFLQLFCRTEDSNYKKCVNYIDKMKAL